MRLKVASPGCACQISLAAPVAASAFLIANV
jgi:hypothetical protein